MKYMHQHKVACFFLGIFTSFLLLSTDYAQADTFKYLRFTVVDLGGTGNANVKISNLSWQMESKQFPLLNLYPENSVTSTSSENTEIIFDSSVENYVTPAYKILEDDGYPLYFSK